MALARADVVSLLGVRVPEERHLRVVSVPAPREPTRMDPDTGTFDDFIGNTDAILDLLPILEDSEASGDAAYPHFLIHGVFGTGKALRDDQPVLTPSGWTPISKLCVGDQVIGSSGSPVNVTGVYPQGVRPLFNVTTSDGITVVADADHLWLTQLSGDRSNKRSNAHQRWTVKTTTEIADTLLTARNYPNHYLPMLTAPVGGEKVDCLLDPWLIGILIGDGCLTQGVKLSNPDKLVLAQVLATLPTGVSLRPQSSTSKDWTLSTQRGKSNPVLDALRQLGIHGCRSHEKHIPTILMRASAGQRHALLTGLLDSDGNCNRGYVVEYSTTSPDLAQQVPELVRSLGGTTHVSHRPAPIYTYLDEKRVGRPAWRILVSLPPAILPFAYSAKRARYVPRSKYPPRRQIASITPADTALATCISVDATDELYITAGHVLTHNTEIAKRIAKRRGTKLHTVDDGRKLRTEKRVVMLFENVREGDVVFIDEIHRLKGGEEALYSLMDTGSFTVAAGSKRDESMETVKVPAFTLIGATTSFGSLDQAFLSRFIDIELRTYTDTEISLILRQAARSLGVEMTQDGADALAVLSRGTARIAKVGMLIRAKAAARLIARSGPGELRVPVVDRAAVELMQQNSGIDRLGLRNKERDFLRALCLTMTGGPIGVEKLASAAGLSVESAKSLETHLVKEGLMFSDGRGRKARVEAYMLLTETDPDGVVFRPPARVVGWSRNQGLSVEAQAWLDSL